jgi:malonate-semialdehyde dehydrogenase (acetylating)/methylmalonate-semialdehyde dehydrogenase
MIKLKTMGGKVTALNFLYGGWQASVAREWLPVHNPATDEILAEVPLSPSDEVDQVVRSASEAFLEWREVPAGERIQFLFRLKDLLERDFEALARQITLENGKTFQESKGELRRAVENIEVACGIPILMQGSLSEDIARGIDEMLIRQPVGVCAIIVPFNFPAMIPFWFLPYALACGNTVVVKPSERVPLTMQAVFRLLEEAGFPSGVANLVNGGPAVVEALLDHPDVAAVSFVGSTAVARRIYGRASANGKRVQAQGGAKNPVVVMPDADLDLSINIISDSAFGNAGQRCLATSLAVTVGEARDPFTEAIADAAACRQVGFGLDGGVEMGPVITQASKDRIEGLIGKGESEGARVLVDGRRAVVPRYDRGYFLRPTILSGLPLDSALTGTEIFGPVLSLLHVDSLDEAIALVNSGAYGNMACIFTGSGGAARKFRHEVEAGNVGINIGVAAPMASFPFSGWKDSFFGTLHGQGSHAVEFFTQTKVVVERWQENWSRKF